MAKSKRTKHTSRNVQMKEYDKKINT